MLSDKDKVWRYLTWNPKNFAKLSGEHLCQIYQSKKPWWKTKFYGTTDEYLKILLDSSSDKIEMLAVVRYWLIDCELPMDATSIKMFDKFHDLCGPVMTEVLDRHENINKILQRKIT